MARAPAAFRDALASLSRSRFVDFVADLWTARGHEVTRSASVLRVRDRAGDRRILFPVVAGGPTRVPAGADVVVTATDAVVAVPDGVACHGPTDLYQLVRYGVPEAQGHRLVDRHLDVTLGGTTTTAESASPPHDRPGTDGAETLETGQDDGTDAGRLARPRRRTVLVAGGVLVSGLAAAAVFRSGDAGTNTRTPDPPDRPALIAPGLTAQGVRDAEVLATGHVDRLQDTSYRVRASKSMHAVGGSLRAWWSVDVAVGPSRAFLARVGTAGSAAPALLGEPPATGAVWSDGTRYRRRRETATGTTVEAIQPRRQINDWYYWSNIVPVGGLPYSTREFYRDLLQTTPVEVSAAETDGVGRRIVASGVDLDQPPSVLGAIDRDAPVTDLRLRGRVTRTGFVPSLLLSYAGRLDGRRVTVRWSIGYADLGEIAIERPEWVSGAGPRTGT